MDVRTEFLPGKLENIPANLLGIDLEMANSFPDQPGVISMVGLGFFDPKRAGCCCTVASITRREEERDLVLWLMGQLADFRRRHRNPALLSFSGLENDIPWLEQRVRQIGQGGPQSFRFSDFGHVDLKREFRLRTQTDKISLKKLEPIFGIHRESQVTSRKVSFILTDVLRDHKKRRKIPPKLFQYLREDVHHLLLIYDRWQETSLRNFNLTDQEYLELVDSLINKTGKLIGSDRLKPEYKKQAALLKPFLADLKSRRERALKSHGFEAFVLPEMPELDVAHSDFIRISKKHRHLADLQLVDPSSGAYRLRRTLFRAKGALAVVRHQGRLLLIRRAEALRRAGGMWGLPGGEVDDGEDPVTCALRELWEEVNLEGRARRVLGVAPSFTGEYDLTWVEVAVKDISTLRPRPEEVQEARWMTPEEAGAVEPLIPGARDWFRKFIGPEWG